MKFLRELFEFLKLYKRLIFLPLILVMLLLGSLIILAEGSVIAPFIYTLF